MIQGVSLSTTPTIMFRWIKELIKDLLKGIVGGILLCVILTIIFLGIVSFDMPDKQGLAERLMELYEMFEI